MRKTLYALLAALTLCGQAISAYNGACYEKFNGMFIGGDLGVLSHIIYRNDLDGFLTDNSSWSNLDTDITGGVQAGINVQYSNRFLGLIADWNKCNVDSLIRDDVNDPADNKFIKNDLDWFSTMRARMGLAAGDALIYLTAGAVVAEIKTEWNDDLINFKSTNRRWGWTAGAGTEFIVCDGWTFGAEALVMSFANKNLTFTDTSEKYSFGNSDYTVTGRVFINYMFDLTSCM